PALPSLAASGRKQLLHMLKRHFTGVSDSQSDKGGRPAKGVSVFHNLLQSVPPLQCPSGCTRRAEPRRLAPERPSNRNRRSLFARSKKTNGVDGLEFTIDHFFCGVATAAHREASLIRRNARFQDSND